MQRRWPALGRNGYVVTIFGSLSLFAFVTLVARYVPDRIGFDSNGSILWWLFPTESTTISWLLILGRGAANDLRGQPSGLSFVTRLTEPPLPESSARPELQARSVVLGPNLFVRLCGSRAGGWEIVGALQVLI